MDDKLIELLNKRKISLEIINQREKEYSLSVDEKGEVCYDKQFLYTFKTLDEQIQLHQNNGYSTEQLLEIINDKRDQSRKYLENLENTYDVTFMSFLQNLGDDPTQSISESLTQSGNQISDLTKKYEKKIIENASLQAELNDLQKRLS